MTVASPSSTATGSHAAASQSPGGPPNAGSDQYTTVPGRLGGSEACPLCGTPLSPEQDWCLRCGAAARTRLAATPNWKAPIATVAVIAALALGVLAAALVKLAGGSGSTAASVTTTVTTAASNTTPTAAVPGVPTTVTPGAAVPGATAPSATTGVLGASTPGTPTTITPTTGSSTPGANGAATAPSATSTGKRIRIPGLSAAERERLRKLGITASPK